MLKLEMASTAAVIMTKLPVNKVSLIFKARECSLNQICYVPKTNRFRVDVNSTYDQLILSIPLMDAELSNEVRMK